MQLRVARCSIDLHKHRTDCLVRQLSCSCGDQVDFGLYGSSTLLPCRSAFVGANSA